MALRNPTDEEAQQIIHGSLSGIFAFKNEPDDPEFLKEIIRWKDILAIPPVTKTFLHMNTLVTTEVLLPGSLPTLNRKLFFKHLDETEQETVKKYRTFLQLRLVLHQEGS
ncbi:MAG TPA: hypothetical protein VGX68_15190 [Thermoanaerobaculia bacterium]|jgi:hypothetical protein|nr:hypothetical protein [Thermoanaerobaculia bacterium]